MQPALAQTLDLPTRHTRKDVVNAARNPQDPPNSPTTLLATLLCRQPLRFAPFFGEGIGFLRAVNAQAYLEPCGLWQCFSTFLPEACGTGDGVHDRNFPVRQFYLPKARQKYTL